MERNAETRLTKTVHSFLLVEKTTKDDFTAKVALRNCGLFIWRTPEICPAMNKAATNTKEPRNRVGSRELVRRLCDEGGFVLVRCDESWGGTYGWTTEGSNVRICGYKTEDAAREGFILDATGSKLGAVMLKMLRELYQPNDDTSHREASPDAK